MSAISKPSPLSNLLKSISSSSSASLAASNPPRPDIPPIVANLPRPVSPPPEPTKPALLNIEPNPLNAVSPATFLKNGLKLPLPKKDPKPLPPASPLNCVPGIPNVKAPNIAALPTGLLTTF